MTRVSHTRSHHGAHRPATLDRPRASRKKKPYKIILEAVTQEKRKVQSILTYHDRAPPGFGYIPLGHPEFTEWCKEQCRQRNLDVHIVSAKPKNRAHHDPDKISHHVHRIGHHFPLDIIELACNKFGYQFDPDKGLRKRPGRTTYGEEYFERGIADYEQRQRAHGRPAIDTETKHHIRGAVREMFPKIPETDLTAIVNHAFEEGTNRVGNAKGLSLARRVQLAVVAHIRHTYTDYDKILKTGSWAEARSKVEHVSLAKLKEWRDEAGEENHELEDTFREVIILDDDDESSDEETVPDEDAREPSMEIVSSRATARDLETDYVDIPRDLRYASGASRRTIVLAPASALSGPSIIYSPSSAHPAPQTARTHTRALPLAATAEPPLKYRSEAFRLAHGRPIASRARPKAYEPGIRDEYPLQMRGSDGQLYNLEPVEGSYGRARTARAAGPPRVEYDPSPSTATLLVPEGYVRPPRRINSLESNHPDRLVLAPSSRRTSEHDVVLPSIEHEPDSVSSPRRSDAPHQYRHERHSASVSYAEVQSPKRKGFPHATYSTEEHAHEQVAKRLKPVYDGDEVHPRFVPSQSGVRRQMPDHEPMEFYSRPRMQPNYETIDLTSSPIRPPYSGDKDVNGPARSRASAGPSSRSYVLAPSRASSMRAPYDVPVPELSRAYIPEYDRMYERRALAPRGHVPLREERPGVEVKSSRYLRSGTNYGGYELH